MKIAIGGDHAGFSLKEKIIGFLKQQEFEVWDAGPFSSDSVDYPDFAHVVASRVMEESVIFGILICGSGNGVAITANKHKGIRAALCWSKNITELARQHNNANILCLPARFISDNEAFEMVDIFLKTPFEGGRHANRVNKIDC